jgi:hypothetical protein
VREARAGVGWIRRFCPVPNDPLTWGRRAKLPLQCWSASELTTSAPRWVRAATVEHEPVRPCRQGSGAHTGLLRSRCEPKRRPRPDGGASGTRWVHTRPGSRWKTPGTSGHHGFRESQVTAATRLRAGRTRGGGPEFESPHSAVNETSMGSAAPASCVLPLPRSSHPATSGAASAQANRASSSRRQQTPGVRGLLAQAVSRPVGPAQAGRAWTPVGRLPPSHGGCRSRAGRAATHRRSGRCCVGTGHGTLKP